MVTKVKPNINSVEVNPQLSNNGHPVDDALVGAGSLWPWICVNKYKYQFLQSVLSKQVS
jgi:hypothetical protein